MGSLRAQVFPISGDIASLVPMEIGADLLLGEKRVLFS